MGWLPAFYVAYHTVFSLLLYLALYISQLLLLLVVLYRVPGIGVRSGGDYSFELLYHTQIPSTKCADTTIQTETCEKRAKNKATHDKTH